MHYSKHFKSNEAPWIFIWDIEGTLNDIMWSFATFDSQDPSKDHADYLERLDAHRRASLSGGMTARPDIANWFEKSELANKATHIALTGTPESFVPSLANWVFQEFQPWFSGVLSLPSCRIGDLRTRHFENKGEFSSRIGASVLIDDEMENCISASASGIGAVHIAARDISVSKLDIALMTALRDGGIVTLERPSGSRFSESE